MAAIEYSIYEVDSRWPGDATIIGWQEAVAIDVGEVFFDSPQTDGAWTVDEVGYNFRHEVALGPEVVSPQADGHLEVRYVLTPTTGDKTIVRFQLKVI